jgi:hypothetical protein
VPAAAFTGNSSTSITALAPPEAAATVDITVTTLAGTSASGSADRFTFNAASAPSVTALSASSGSTAGGSVITVTGSGFTGASAVSFGSVAATSFTVLSDTSLVATAPSQAAATVDLTVTSPAGTSSTGSADHFTYSAAAAPSVTGITASSGTTPGGTLVTVSGSGFTGATAVNFGSLAAAFTVYTDGTLVATSPPSAAGTFHITVSTPSGTSSTSSADQFTYTNVRGSAPAVTAVSPNTGSTAGGQVVTVTGTGFTGATGVSFGSTAASSYQIVSDTTVTATAPAGSAGTVDIKVTTNNGTSSAVTADHFTYLSTAAPTVTGVSPTSGSTAGGTSVTVTGTNFTGATAVTFGGVAASSFTVNSSTSITATSPAQPVGTIDICVTTPSGTSAVGSADHFSFTAASAPTVTSLGTSSGSNLGGISVTITGTNFTGATGVFFGGVAAASFTVSSSTSITATSPAQAAGTYDVTIATYSATSATASGDRYTATLASAPTVTAVSPTSGSTAGGTSVTLTGTNFTGATGVFFGGVAATTFTVNSSTSITATAPPEAAATIDTTVQTYAGSSAVGSADHFTFTAASAPTVSSVSPSSGSTGGGTSVTVTGTGFTGATGVSFGSVAASFTVNSDTSITATAPAQAAGTVDITVTTYAATSSTSANDHYTYSAAAAPAVTSVSPSSGSTSGGATVTVLGSGFTGASAVSFGSTAAASFLVISDTAILATSPAATTGTIDISVTTPSGSSSTSSSDHFTFNAAAVPSVSSLSSSSGSTAGGSVITITGSGFTGASGVSFGSTAASQFMVNSDTLLTVLVPPGTAGTWDVTVSGPGGSSPAASGDRYTYTLGSAPTVTAVSPSTGSSSAGGAAVTLTGTNFTGATAVSFGGTAAAAFTVVSSTQIIATAPPLAAATYDVVVTTPAGSSAVGTADHFATTAAAAPSVSSVSPATGSDAGSTVVTITGSGFTGASAVSFGGTAGSFSVYSDTTLVATAPAASASGTYDLVVTTPSGSSSTGSGDHYAYTAGTAPAVRGILPSSGTTAGGTVVTVSGLGFTGATGVSFGSTAATGFTVLSDTLISAIAPAGTAGTADITVVTASGTSSTGTADQFTFAATSAPAVTSLSTSSGSTVGGTVVTLTGTNFTGAYAVYFGTVAATAFTVLSDTSILAQAPAQAAGTVDIQVSTANGSSALGTADHFTYNAATGPSVTSLSTTSGTTAGGTVVTVNGSGFTAATAVKFGTVAATAFTVLSDTQVLATAPAQTSGTVDVTVTTPTSTSSTGSADHFTYSNASAPTVSSVTPSSGTTAGGTLVTIFGTNLAGVTGVTFGGTAATIIASYGSTAVIAQSPAHAVGTVDILVTTYAATSSAVTADHFTYSSSLLASGTPGAVADSFAPSNTPGGGLSGDSVALYVDNSNGELTSDELARIDDAVAAVDAAVAPYGVAVTEVSDPTLANFTLTMDSGTLLGGLAEGVLACTSPAQVTVVEGWGWYAGSDATQIGGDQYDFQTVLTHELGHTLGLGHNADPSTVMYALLGPGEVKRALTATDLSVRDGDHGPGGLHAAAPAARTTAVLLPPTVPSLPPVQPPALLAWGSVALWRGDPLPGHQDPVRGNNAAMDQSGAGWQPQAEGAGLVVHPWFTVPESGGGGAANLDGGDAFAGSDGPPDDAGPRLLVDGVSDATGDAATALEDADAWSAWDQLFAEDAPEQATFTDKPQLEGGAAVAIDLFFADWIVADSW